MNKETRVMLVLFAIGLQAAQLQCHCRSGYVLANGQASGTTWDGGCSPSNVTDCTCDHGVVVGDETMRSLVCENSGGQACSQCDPGYMFESFACVPYDVCPNGTPDVGLLSCASCDVGYQLINGNCRPCRSYENWVAGTCHSIYQECPAGSEHNGTHCSACASGRFKSATDAGRCKAHTATSTLLCGLGTFQDGSLASPVSDAGCTQCPAGQYQDEFNQPTCKQHADLACVPNIEVEVGERTFFSTKSCGNNTAAVQMTSALATPAEDLVVQPQTTPTTTADESKTNPFIIIAVVLSVSAMGVGIAMYRHRQRRQMSSDPSEQSPAAVDMLLHGEDDALLHHIGALRLVF